MPSRWTDKYEGYIASVLAGDFDPKPPAAAAALHREKVLKLADAWRGSYANRLRRIA